MKFTEEKLKKIQDSARERTVRTQTVEYGLDTLLKRISDSVIKLDPDYQRHHRWDDITSSRLIESLILNIPIPYIYISKDVDVDTEVDDLTRYTVIDGQQRLSAIRDFLTGIYGLSGLKVLPNLEGVKYDELPSFIKRRLDERTIKCLIIDSTLDREVKYEIFERLNTGSLELSNQEVRNAVYRGPFNNLIKTLAEDKLFKKMLYIKPVDDIRKNKKQKTMEDVEIVLRFFAFSYKNGYKDYSGDLKEYLNTKMELFNTLNDKELEALKLNFEKTLRNIDEKLKENWFSKFKKNEKTLKVSSNFNVSVYDAIVVSVSVIGNADDLTREKLNKIFAEKEFSASIEGSTMDSKKVVYRINRIMRLLKNGN